ncbi:acetyltransferase [Clostridium sp.]|uniref:acetyltransferase n=1 Tax=Clostridium sp. TaxID=1506 RepID=UPI002FC6405F
MDKILILGGSGHAKVVLDLIESTYKYRIVGFVDKGVGEVLGFPIVGDDSVLNDFFYKGVKYASIGIGDNFIRGKLYESLKELGYNIPRLIHNTAIVSNYALIGEGTNILPGVMINASAQIGENCIINTGAIIEHDCKIGNNVHISPGAKLAGGIIIGNNTHIGIGATIMQNIVIGDNVIIGAGAVVIDNIPNNAVCVGVPAKIIKYR